MLWLSTWGGNAKVATLLSAVHHSWGPTFHLMKKKRFSARTGCVAAILAVALTASAETSSVDPVQLLRALDQGFTAIFEKVAPAVVVIETSKSPDSQGVDPARALEMFLQDRDAATEEPFDAPVPKNPPPSLQESEGSGFVFREDGFIVTNSHVIEGAVELHVRMKDGRRMPATIVGQDDKTDIAVIRVAASGLPTVEFADSEEVKVGQLVCSIGIPFSLDYSFSCGWVSGKGRSKLTQTTYEDYIQTDAFINPGNSGGPLLDVSGRVIGMNTLINGIGRGLAFAIPSNMIKEVSAQLAETGKIERPWLGIRIETLDDSSSFRTAIQGVENGVVVATVVSGAPAAKSDLRQADVITEVDHVRVQSDMALQKEILRKKVGQSVELTVWRNGAFLKIPVITGKQPDRASLSRLWKKNLDSKKKE